MSFKCESFEKGFLKDPDNPDWRCVEKATMDMELKGKETGQKISASVCDKCAEKIFKNMAGISL